METTARRALSELIDQLLVPGAEEPVAGVVPAPAPPTSPVFQLADPVAHAVPQSWQPTPDPSALAPVEPDSAPAWEPPLQSTVPLEPSASVQPPVQTYEPAQAYELAPVQPPAQTHELSPVQPPAQAYEPAPVHQQPGGDDLVGLEQFGIQVQPDHPVRPVPVQRAAEPPALPGVPQAFTVLPGGAKSAIMWRSRQD